MSTGSTTSATISIGRLADNPGFLAARFSWFAARVSNASLEAFELTTRPYSVLELAAVGGGVTQRDIVRILRLDPSAVVGLVDQLADRGLVVRRQDPRDRRRTVVCATDDGVAMADEAARALDAGYAEMLGSLSDDERNDVIGILRALAGLPDQDIRDPSQD